MIGHHRLAAAVAALTAVVILATAGVLVLAHTHRPAPARAQVAQSSAAAPAPYGSSGRPATPTPAPVGSDSEARLLAAVRSFAHAYARYLAGADGGALERAGDVTAAAQAVQGGRIPVTFRDGPLKVRGLDSLEQTCCSASVTVVLADREQTFPFTEDLLLEDGRWLVDQITPADLAMDRSVPAPVRVTEPAGGEASARAFATSYLNYRTRVSRMAPAMTATAAAQLRAGTDSLAGQRLPKAAGRLVAIRFGPPSGTEFAATATVTAGPSTVSFSFLMVRTEAGWECGQFL